MFTIDVLKDFLSDVPAQKKKLEDLTAAYVAGNLAGLEAIVFDEEEMAKFPKMMEILLDRRNQDWVPKIEKRIAAGNVFIAVGAAHLIGEKGVVKLLEKKGHSVKRVGVPQSAQD